MYYAVVKGHRTGIFNSWDETKDAINCFSDPKFKKFKLLEEAKKYYNKHVGEIKKREQYIDKTSKLRVLKPIEIKDASGNKNYVAEKIKPEIEVTHSIRMPVRNSMNKICYRSEEVLNKKTIPLVPLNQRKTIGKPKSLIKVVKKSDVSDASVVYNTPSKQILVFTDGSTFNNGQKNAVGGYGVHFEPPVFNDISEKYDDDTATNQKCELMAAYLGIKTLNDNQETMNKECIKSFNQAGSKSR